MFKRQPKPREDTIIDGVMQKINAQSKDQQEAVAAFDEGQRLEAEGEEEGAIEAYLASATAWERYHQTTGHPVKPEAYLRLGILLRRAKALDMEVRVLESYMAHAGRDPDQRVQERLQRVYELIEPDDEWED